MWADEIILVSCHSAFQQILLTENSSGLRILRFGEDGAAQSVVNPHNPRRLHLAYARLLPACLAFVEHARRALVVGLGGGSLPRFLHAHFEELAIDVVEIDGIVLDLAERHCGLRQDERLRVVIDDARDFIESTEAKYELVVLDCFDAESIPAHLTTQEFLGSVRNLLTGRGVIAANIWGPAQNPLYADMLRTYRAAFEDVYVFDVPGPETKLFVALPFRRAMSRDELLSRIREMSRSRGFEYDLAAAVAGFRSAAEEKARAGVVLQDSPPAKSGTSSSRQRADK